MRKTCLLTSLIAIAIAWGVPAPASARVDTTRVDLPLLATGVADEVPGDFARALDDLYERWHAGTGAANRYHADTVAMPATFPAVPDETYLSRLDSINSIIPLSYNGIVRDYIKLYTERRREQVAVMLGLSEYYFPLFEEALEREGLPHELKYLPVIESALNPRARSSAGAAGLWQFILPTGKQYGLEINSFVDERRDPQRSSAAAARFLKDLHAIYGDWFLVLAAYNSGPGTVNKAIRRAGDRKNYWDIYYNLPRETRGYVPAFIAAMYVFHYHDRHDIYPLASQLPPLCDSISLTRALHFEQVSTLLDISTGELRDLNPQYRADVIPAGFGRTYALRLPYRHVGDFIDRQDTIFAHRRDHYFGDKDRVVDPRGRVKQPAPAAPANKTRVTYTVKSGDVAGVIAARFNVRLADLKYWNGMETNLIRVGQVLVVYVDPGDAARHAA
ncbi:MAG: transglycosylase SLT domain-containing protein, partial [Odoribacteraceae bacterium]|nr:transglycosylase SLT domain-containing protein [Odoribacteraceae bacterium]